MRPRSIRPSVRLAFEPRAGGRFEEHYDDGRFAYHVQGTVTVYEPRGAWPSAASPRGLPRPRT